MSNIELTVEEYSARSLVVRGDTETYKTGLMKLGGKYNGGLKGGGGWIFSKKYEDKIRTFVKEGSVHSIGDVNYKNN